MTSFRSMSGMVARLTLGVALMALASVAQAAVEKGSAKVLALQGAVETSTDGATWTALNRGDSLREGAMIRTTTASAADLDLGRNGSRLRVMPGSTVALTALTYEQTGVETAVNTQIDVRAGKVVGVVQKLSSISKYEIKTAKAVATVRGTRYSMDASGKLVVAEGSVVVVAFKDDGSTVTRVVNANEAFSPISAMVAPATEGELSDVGGSASSVPGIVALPPLQQMIFDTGTALDRTVLPAGVAISRSVPPSTASSAPTTGGGE